MLLGLSPTIRHFPLLTRPQLSLVIDQMMGVSHIMLDSNPALIHFCSIMGMGNTALSTLHSDPFFMTAMANDTVQSGEFAFKLSQNGSELYLGGTDSSLYSGDIEYHSVNASRGFWQVSGGTIKVNGNTLEFSFDAVIDTGTTLMFGPPSALDALWGLVPGSQQQLDGTYSFPCDKPLTIAFNFEGGNDWEIDLSK
jgi:cathepsin D